MSSDRRVRAYPFRLKTLGAAVASIMLAANVHAAALGKLSVLSALGQPLHAEVELISVAPEDTGSLQAKVAPFDTFRQANIEYNPVLSSLRFSIEQRGEGRVIRITSAQPISEPFFDLLLELRGGEGRLVREYLFLLDPPMSGFNESAASPAVVTSAAPALPSAGNVPQPARASSDSRPAERSSSEPARQPKRAVQARTPATSPVEEAPAPRPRTATSGKPRLSLTDVSVSPGGGTFPAEERAAMERAVAEANERVKLLEQKVDAMQKLLAATNNLLAELRKHNETQRPLPQGDAPASAVPAQVSAGQASASVGQAAPVAAPVTSASAGSVPAASTPAPVAPRPKPHPVPPPPSPPETGLLDNLFALSIGGLAVLLLGGAGAYIARRRRKQKSVYSGLLNDATATQATTPAPAVTQEADADQSVFIPGLGDSAEGTGSDDPVAEADVYIAYGRDGQAEDILKDALRNQPERHAVRLKLMSIYASRKDRDSFERLAAELHAMTKGQGDEWARAAALGAAIDPGNALYAAHLPKAETHAPASGGNPDEMLAIPPAGPAQEEGRNAPAFDFTRETASPAESAPGPGLPPLDAAPIDLDFALGIPPAAEAPVPEPVPVAVAEEHPSGPGPIDFDLGLPAEPALAEFVEPAPKPEVPEQIVAEIAAEIAAEIPPLEPEPPSPPGPGPIEFELPELLLSVPEAEDAAPAASGDIASGPGPIDFELPELPLAAPEEPAPKADASSDPGAMDFDFELPEIPALAQPEENTEEAPQAASADAGAAIDLDGMLADLMPVEKKPK